MLKLSGTTLVRPHILCLLLVYTCVKHHLGASAERLLADREQAYGGGLHGNRRTLSPTSGRSCEALALLVSGQAYRFVYRDMFEKFGNVQDYFGCPIDFYAVLSSAKGPQHDKANNDLPYASDVLDDTHAVARFLRKYGFNDITFVIMPEEEVSAAKAQLLHDLTLQGGGQEWFDDLKPVFSACSDAKYPRNSQMFYLRNKVYNHAKSLELTKPYRYSHFMYLREDIAFQRTPHVNFAQIFLHDEPSVLVSKFCSWGATNDEIYFGNRRGLDVLFGRDYHALVTNLVFWLNLGAERLNNSDPLQQGDPLQNGFFLQELMKRNGVNILPVDFETNILKYGPEACISIRKWECAANNTFPKCDHSAGALGAHGDGSAHRAKAAKTK